MFLSCLPEDRFARGNGLTFSVGATHPTRAVDDHEELRHDGWVPADDSAGADLDHDRMGLGRKAAHSSSHASGSRHLPFAAEVDALQSRSTTQAIAWPKPMHIVATP
jgi:hypothetical protein